MTTSISTEDRSPLASCDGIQRQIRPRDSVTRCEIRRIIGAGTTAAAPISSMDPANSANKPRPRGGGHIRDDERAE
jgi:hypothetical protein